MPEFVHAPPIVKTTGTLIALSALAMACTSPKGTPSDGGAPGDSTTDAGPEPFLTALRVSFSNDASAANALVPEFSSSIHDYYVRCRDGTNAVEVSMAAGPGASCALSAPQTSPKAPDHTLSVDVLPNQAIVATASDETATTEYWVRCLPPDFPSVSMVRHPTADEAPPGYYLLGSAVTGLPDYAMVVDGHGVPVWYIQFNPSNVDDVDSLAPGSISFNPTALAFEVRHVDPLTTTFLAPKATVLNTHDLRRLPNGNFVVLSDPVETGVDLSGVESFGKDATILDCNVVEFEPKGAVVWTWVGTHHIDPQKETVSPELATLPEGGVAVDPFHCNSVDVDPANGNLLVSARDMNAVFYVDRSTSAVVWKLGGTHYNKDGATLIALADPFYGQHDARIQSWSTACGGKGQISVFDDHSGMPGPARGLVVDVTVGPAGGACGAATPGATPAWQYAGKTNSVSRGSFRILADGSRVIGWGQAGSPSDPAFTEVDVGGTDRLDFYFPANDFSYRAIKVPLDTFDLGALRRAAGLPR
jgi:WD40 repeat protein